MVRETQLGVEHLVYPMFVQEGETDEPIETLPG